MIAWRWVGVWCLVFVGACSSAPKLTDDGRMVRDVDAFLADLARSYEQRNVDAVIAAVSPDFANRDGLRRTIEETFGRYSDVRLDLTVERIHLDGRMATVFAHWDGRWAGKDREAVERQGIARFVVESGAHPLLVSVIGDTPFEAGVSAPAVQ